MLRKIHNLEWKGTGLTLPMHHGGRHLVSLRFWNGSDKDRSCVWEGTAEEARAMAQSLIKYADRVEELGVVKK